MRGTEKQPIFHTVHKGMFSARHIGDLNQLAEKSKGKIHIHILRREGEYYVVDGSNLEQDSGVGSLERVRHGVNYVAIMRRNNRRPLSHYFWHELDKISRHPSRKREPIRSKRRKNPLRTESAISTGQKLSA